MFVRELRCRNEGKATQLLPQKYNSIRPESVTAQCRSKEFVNHPLGRSSILSVAVAKVDIQPISKLQLVIASPRIAETTKWTKDERWECGSAALWARTGSIGEAEVTGRYTR